MSNIKVDNDDIDLDAFISDNNLNDDGSPKNAKVVEEDLSIDDLVSTTKLADNVDVDDKVNDESTNDETESTDETQNDDDLLTRISNAGEEQEESEEDNSTKSKGLPANVQKKIDREVAKRKQLQEQLQQQQAQLSELFNARNGNAINTQHNTNNEFKAPQTAEEFKHMVRQMRADEARQEKLEKEKQERHQEQLNLIKQANEIDDVGAELFDDYHDKVTPSVDKGLITQAMVHEIARLDSKAGAKVAYYLSSNTELAKIVSQMPIIDQIREIAAINARLSSKAHTKKVSTSPKPTELKSGSTVAQNKSKSKLGAEDDSWAAADRLFKKEKIIFG